MDRRLIILFFVLLPLFCRAQLTSFDNERRFLQHLDSLNLNDEKIAYLESIRNEIIQHDYNDLILELAHSYFQLKDYTKSFAAYASVRDINDTRDKKEYGFSMISNGMYRDYENDLRLSATESDSILSIQKLSASVLANPSDVSLRQQLRCVINLSVPENKLRKKSPLLAGLLSAVVPGTGKLYCGRKNQFLTTFIANGALGYQTFEAYDKDGAGSVRFIASGILFSFFYIGNIWSSIIQAKNYYQENYRQLEHEIIDYNNRLVTQQ